MMPSKSIRVDNPFTLETYCQIPMVSESQAQELVTKAASAQKEWRNWTLSERQVVCRAWMKKFEERKSSIAVDVTGQMGKPLKQALGEVDGTLHRATVLLELSDNALATDEFQDSPRQLRQIVKEPVGTVLVMAPWNYPMMTTINSILPALLAGNAVILKHSPRTPLCAQHYVDSFEEAGLPDGLLTALHCENPVVASVIQRPEIGFVSFTGSVRGGSEINKVASTRFIHTTLELGGKDAAYVASDADPEDAAKGLVDGAFYNAGQSCCSVERVYVAESKYEEFLEHAKRLVNEYHLGDPMDDNVTLGPVAQPEHLEFLQSQVDDAVAKGARLLTATGFAQVNGRGRFFHPTLLADCTHSMKIMQEETFGPIMAVSSVSSDKEALEKMNDSVYGLTAAIFTKDKEKALRLGKDLRVGTVYMNRCDALDPYLPWTGVGSSGKGQSLSKYGFGAFTQLKSYNFNID